MKKKENNMILFNWKWLDLIFVKIGKDHVTAWKGAGRNLESYLHMVPVLQDHDITQTGAYSDIVALLSYDWY